jgi:hypothetical protein
MCQPIGFAFAPKWHHASCMCSHYGYTLANIAHMLVIVKRKQDTNTLTIVHRWAMWTMHTRACVSHLALRACPKMASCKLHVLPPWLHIDQHCPHASHCDEETVQICHGHEGMGWHTPPPPPTVSKIGICSCKPNGHVQWQASQRQSRTLDNGEK